MAQLRLICSLVAAFALAACATLPETRDLEQPAASASEKLTISATLVYPIPDLMMVVNLPAAQYSVEKQNAVGRYFISQHGYFWWQVNDVIHARRGGIWVPRDPSMPPRLWFYAKPQLRGRNLEEALGVGGKSDPSGNQVITHSLTYPPAGVSPLAAGLGGAIASVMIDAIEAQQIRLLPASPDLAVAEALRAAVSP